MTSPTLSARIVERREELEAAILTRIRSDGAPTEATDPEYAEGLRGAIPVSVDYCLAAISAAEASPPPIPASLRAQARVAARNEIPLDTVLRRYFAGYVLLGDLLIEELDTAGPRRGQNLQRLQRLLATSFDRLLTAVSEEYREEERSSSFSSEQRRAELIQRMLAGEPLNPPELNYDFAAHHLAMAAKGSGAAEVLRQVASSLERRLLVLDRKDGTVWAWLGGNSSIEPEGLRSLLLSTEWPSETFLAIGEPGRGFGGWRFTYQQARAALPVALRGDEPCVRYGEVAMLAAVLKDDLLANSLRQMYLTPLEARGDKGNVLLKTLSAYFKSQGSVSSAASVLGVKRETVSNRLRVAESVLGHRLTPCNAEMESALRLHELIGG